MKYCDYLKYTFKYQNIQYLKRLGQTFFILWFTDIFAPYPMSGFGIKIKIKFQSYQTYIGFQAIGSLFLPILRSKLFRITGN